MFSPNRRLTLKLVAAAAMTTPLTTLAQAQQYPNQPIRMLIGFSAGGTTDVIGRLIGRELSEQLGQSVVVENHPGASGIIAGGLVAKAKPDGYTLLMVSSLHATTPYLYKTMPYDANKDLVPVSLIASTPYVLVVHPSMPVHNLGELITLLKNNPGKYNYASSGAGSAQHLASEMLQRTEGVKMTHVPYKGSGAALPDVLSGRVPIMFENVALMTPQIQRGALRPIVVTSGKRTPLLPDVPTAIESGLPNFEVLGWFGIFVPAGTPPEVIKRINAAVNKVITLPSVKQTFAQLGAEALGGTPDHLGSFFKGEQDKWGGLIRDTGITLQ